MKERAYRRLQHGEEINLSELSHYGNDLIQVLWELDNEVVTGQYKYPLFKGECEELVLNRVKPLERTYHEHQDKTNPLTEADRLSLCRAELARIK